MKKFSFFLLVLPFILGGYSGKQIQKEFKASPGMALEVNLKTGGELVITGWDKGMVSLEARIGGRDADDVRFAFDESAEAIEVESRFQSDGHNRSASIKVEIRVPAKFDLQVKTMGGDVAISNVEGSIRGTTMGGELDFRNLKGRIRFTTMGGEVTLKDSDLDGSIETMGGRLLFENVSGDVKGSSMGGQVIMKNVKRRNGVSSGKEVVVSTMGGDINVSEAPEGASVKTMGGDIQIHSAEKFVKATTMGGDIEVDSVDGWIEATTMGGDIEVVMVGKAAEGKRDVRLESYGGDVDLTVPADLSMDIEIELAYTRDSSENFTITSDFPLNQTRSSEWDDHHGTPRKYIYGKAQIGGAKNKIRIKTINGDIVLKKR